MSTSRAEFLRSVAARKATGQTDRMNLESGVGSALDSIPGIEASLTGGEGEEQELTRFLNSGKEANKTAAPTELKKLVIPPGLEEKDSGKDAKKGNDENCKPPNEYAFDTLQDYLNRGVPVNAAAVLTLAVSILELALIHKYKR